MAGTGERAESIEACPFCGSGDLIFSGFSDGVTCNGCRRRFYLSDFIQKDVPGTGDFPHRPMTESAERNLAFALSEIGRIAAANNLPPSVRGSADSIYRKAMNRDLIRGRPIDALAAAAVYAACRISGIPRTMDEIAENGGVGRKELGRTYRHLSKELGLALSPARPQDYIGRYCDALKLGTEVREKALSLIRKASENDLLSGLGPAGVTAAAVYISAIICGEHRSQRQVAEAAGISEVTLRDRYRKLADGLGIRIEFS